jgi:diadenosine tetraphosphate (Ap4A) HIT family hydrolase
MHARVLLQHLEPARTIMSQKLPKLMDDCPFCIEFRKPERKSEFQAIYKNDPKSRVIAETENFVIIPDLSPLVPGHLLLVPKWHYTSLSPLPDGLWNEFLFIRSKLVPVLTDLFGETIQFEHGASSTNPAGHCIEHAHLHFVPAHIDLLPNLKQYRAREIKEIDEIREYGSRDIPYLFSQTADGTMFIADGFDAVPSQFLRRFAAKQIGIPDGLWDWGIYINKSFLRETIRSFERVSMFV